MSKLQVKNFAVLSKRCYRVGKERQSEAEGVAKKGLDKKCSERETGTCGGAKDIFWMRDPDTGNWIPETHFGQIDVADLRRHLLSHKH